MFLDIVHEDKHHAIINKPAGMVCHPAPGHESGTLADIVAELYADTLHGSDSDRPGIVHRLDKDTSGLMIVAKTAEAHTAFTELIKHGKGAEIRRFYLCLVHGSPRPVKGRIEAPIGRHPRHRQKFAVVESGKNATTLYETVGIKQFGAASVSLVRCELLSGRTHQIRVHMRHIRCPVIGDKTYGLRRPSLAIPEALRNFSRQALHSCRIEFVHPITGEHVTAEVAPPADMQSAIVAAGLA